MKRVIVTVLLLSVALGAGAQDMAPPPPLDDSHFGWLIGEWQGTNETPMGTVKEWVKYEMGVGGQFVLIDYKNESDMGTFTGKGALTVSQDGSIKGVWFDSWRTISNGKGTREGKTTKMVWDGAMGKQTRVMERIGDDTYVEKITMSTPQGEMQATSEMKRVKKKK